MTLATFHSDDLSSADPVSGEPGSNFTFRIVQLFPSVKAAIPELLLNRYDAHLSRGIGQLPPAIEAANVVESPTIAVRPCDVPVGAVKDASQNPSDPFHGQILVRSRGPIVPAGF